VKRGSTFFAVLILAVAVVYEIMALYMPRGRLSYPGPGFFPMMVGAFLIVTALGCVLQEVLPRKRGRKQPEEASPDDGNRQVSKTVQLIVLMIGYILGLQPLGFPIVITVFLVLSIRIFGYRRWLPALAMALIIGGISYVSFVVWLKVPLPLGILEEVLG
jgi:putative tricarboxylic transport membrane protein